MKHGVWIKAQYSEKDGDALCSECGHWDWSYCHYCSNCGAKMDGKEKEPTANELREIFELPPIPKKGRGCEGMARYINIDRLQGMIQAKADTLLDGKEAFLYIAKWLDKLPAADVVEVKHGTWENVQCDNFRKYKVICSCCNAEYMGNYDAYIDPDNFNYCPNCGAKMDDLGEDIPPF